MVTGLRCLDQRRRRRWAGHDQTQDASESRPICYFAVLQSRVIQELDLASGSLIINHDRILPSRRCLSVLADVPNKISKNVDPRMGKGNSEFGHRVVPEDGTRSEKTINSRNDFRASLPGRRHIPSQPRSLDQRTEIQFPFGSRFSRCRADCNLS
jgi:hypothetical protein